MRSTAILSDGDFVPLMQLLRLSNAARFFFLWKTLFLFLSFFHVKYKDRKMSLKKLLDIWNVVVERVEMYIKNVKRLIGYISRIVC